MGSFEKVHENFNTENNIDSEFYSKQIIIIILYDQVGILGILFWPLINIMKHHNIRDNDELVNNNQSYWKIPNGAESTIFLNVIPFNSFILKLTTLISLCLILINYMSFYISFLFLLPFLFAIILVIFLRQIP